MLRLATRIEHKEDVKVSGDFCLFDLHEGVVNSGIMFCCPHEGCNEVTHLPLQPKNPTGWNWNEATKTLSPSILRTGGGHCRHHFSLIEGKWIP